jgi:hypothetical protein
MQYVLRAGFNKGSTLYDCRDRIKVGHVRLGPGLLVCSRPWVDIIEICRYEDRNMLSLG